MKRFLILSLFVFFTFSLTAQDWALPQDTSPKKVINWATPADGVTNFDYPFQGSLEYYTYLGSRKQRRNDRSGSYILRIPNKFKGNGLLTTGYKHKYTEVTWAVGEPDASAGYTETKISWQSDWAWSSEDPILSYRTQYDVGTVTFLNDVIIGGSVAFKKGYTKTVGDSGIGHGCYSYTTVSEDGISSNCIGANVQYVYNSDSDLYYQFVKAADNSNALILWGIFSTSSKYQNQPKSTQSSNTQSKNSSSQKTSTVNNSNNDTKSNVNWTQYTKNYPFSYSENKITYTVRVPKRFTKTEGFLEFYLNPDPASGYTTTTFTAHGWAYETTTFGFFLKIDSDLKMYDKVILETGSIYEPKMKSDYGLLKGTSLPENISYLSGADYKNYYFVQAADDPYTLILWGMDK